MQSASKLWTEKERVAWYPPERLTPSAWTEKHRILPTSVAAEAGKLRLSRTPYVIGILDAITETGVEEIVCLKSTQVGWSTATESLIGYFVDNDPGPILLVLDSQKTAQEVMDERIRPLVDSTPAVNQHLSPHAHDNTLQTVKFDSCPLFIGWAGSPGTLARRAVRYLICDEVDKYPNTTGKEADPISLAVERTQTYGYRRRILIGSTPTVRSGTIYRAWEGAGDKRRYHVPCPHCSEFQVLVFGQIKYPPLSIPDKNVYADAIEQQNLAYYECASCRLPIKESDKPKMLSKGLWLSEGQSIDASGKIAGHRPKAKRVAFTINSLYSPWRTFSAIAAEHRRSLNDPVRLQNFRNSWLAEVWEEVVRTASVEDYRKLLIGAPKAGIVPAWAEYIVASADVQKDRFYWVIRAWGAEYKSQLVTFGLALSFEELKRHCLETQYSLKKGGTSRGHALFIDAGYRTDEIYEFARTDDRIKPVKGDSDNQTMLVKYSTAGKQWGLPLYILNTQLLKDRLGVFRNNEGRWLLNDAVSDEYLQHLASEHKTIVKGQERWEPKSSGGANHYLDCEVYQLAAAEVLRVDLLTVGETATHVTGPIETAELGIAKKKPGWLGNTSNWLGNK